MRFPALLFYDVDELAQVAAGTLLPYEVQPYDYMILDEYFYRSGSTLGEWVSNTFQSGITTDGTTIFIGEFNGDPVSYSKFPLVHTFSVGAGGTQDTTAPAASASGTVTESGVVQWSSVDGAAIYVVYKYFPLAYRNVSEYRPIRSTTGTTWTDPLYQAGDQYQVVALDRSANQSAELTISGESPAPSPPGTGRIRYNPAARARYTETGGKRFVAAP